MDSTERFGGHIPQTLGVPRWYALGILDILGYSSYFNGMPLCLWTFFLDGLNGPVMLGSRVMGPIRSVSRVHAYEVELIFLERYILGLPKS